MKNSVLLKLEVFFIKNVGKTAVLAAKNR
jgi:hypothetical protein